LRPLPACGAADAGRLLKVGLSPAAKVLDLKGRFRCRGCGRKGRAIVSVKWRGSARNGQLTDRVLAFLPAGSEARLSGPGGKGAAPDGGTSRRRPRSPSTRPDGRRAGLSYVPPVNGTSAETTASFLAFAGLCRGIVGLERVFADPAERHKSPRPSVAQAPLEPRVPIHVSRSGVAEGRSIVPLPEGLLN
jgi:hypothetical protein